MEERKRERGGGGKIGMYVGFFSCFFFFFFFLNSLPLPALCWPQTCTCQTMNSAVYERKPALFRTVMIIYVIALLKCIFSESSQHFLGDQ